MKPFVTNINPDRHFLIEHIRLDKRIVRAKGHYLYDDTGSAYLDFVAQFGAVPFGHNPDALWDVIFDIRACEEPAFTQPLISPAAEALAAELVAIAPGAMRYVTYTNSGAETVEAAIKLARAHTRRPTILGTTTGFHGKTLGAVSVTGNPDYRETFLVDTSSFEHLPYGDVDALANRLARKDVAAFIVEPVQGEGGMVTPPPGYFREAERLCREHKTLFVLDEIQTGLGRTGRLFAAEHDGLSPDILLLAKALGGGLVPLGACVCTAKVWSSDFGLYHSSTFANNHFTCRIGLAALRLLQQNDRALVRQVDERGRYLRVRLARLIERYPRAFEQVDGQGLMLGLRLASWSGEDSHAMAIASSVGQAVPLVCGYLFNEHHLLTLPTISRKNVLRLEPALTIEQAELDRAVEALEDVADLLHRGDFARLLAYTTGRSAKRVSAPRRSWYPAELTSTFTPPRPAERCLGRFAFLMHPTELADILRAMPASVKAYDRDATHDLMQWLQSWCSRRNEPGVAFHVPALRSRQGGYVEGWLISSLLTPSQMLRMSRREHSEVLAKHLAVAREYEANIVGLGAFLSVVTRGGLDVADSSLILTTGNSLTAMAASESLVRVAHKRRLDLSTARTAVVGAAGSVGRVVCKRLAMVCGSLTLFGNPTNPRSLEVLWVLAGELYQQVIKSGWKYCGDGIGLLLTDLVGSDESGSLKRFLLDDDETRCALAQFIHDVALKRGVDAPIQVTIDLARYLPRMHAVVSATSQGHAFIDPAWLGPDTIVCDVARPPDVHASVSRQRNDVFVYEGGLLSLPEHVRFGSSNVLGFPTGVNLGCLSETIALCMAQVQRHYSLGQQIPFEEAESVYEMALQHGFSVHAPTMETRPPVTAAEDEDVYGRAGFAPAQ